MALSAAPALNPILVFEPYILLGEEWPESDVLMPPIYVERPPATFLFGEPLDMPLPVGANHCPFVSSIVTICLSSLITLIFSFLLVSRWFHLINI